MCFASFTGSCWYVGTCVRMYFYVSLALLVQAQIVVVSSSLHAIRHHNHRERCIRINQIKPFVTGRVSSSHVTLCLVLSLGILSDFCSTECFIEIP